MKMFPIIKRTAGRLISELLTWVKPLVMIAAVSAGLSFAIPPAGLNISNMSHGMLSIGTTMDPDFYLAVATGELSPIHDVREFGENPQIEDVGVPEDLWDCPQLAAGVPEVYPFQGSAYTMWVSSDDEADAGLTVSLEGLDENWDEQTVQVTLGADTGFGGTAMVPAGDAGGWVRLNNSRNDGDTDYSGNLYFNTSSTDAGADGVPDTLTNLQGCIRIGNNHGSNSMYTVPRNHEAYLEEWCQEVSAEGSSSTVAGDFEFHLRSATTTGTGVFYLIDQSSRTTSGTTDYCHEFIIPFKIPEKSDLRWTFQASTQQDPSAGVRYDMVLLPTISTDDASAH